MLEKFHEHIIRLPEQSGAMPITRKELWEGLERFVRESHLFIDALESVHIVTETTHEDGSLVLEREVDYGNFKVKDEARLKHGHEVILHIKPSAQWPESICTMRIEEPEEGVLFVRFIYEAPALTGEDAHPMYVNIRRQAYEDKDARMIGKILEMFECCTLPEGQKAH